MPTRHFEMLIAALNAERKALEGLGLTPPTKAALAQTTAQTGVAAATLADLQATGRAVRLAAGERMAVEVSATGSAPERPAGALEPGQAVGGSPRNGRRRLGGCVVTALSRAKAQYLSPLTCDVSEHGDAVESSATAEDLRLPLDDRSDNRYDY